MAEENKIKFPLSKKLKAEFSEKYELIYMKKPVHNISDEKLVEMVNSHPEKLKANAQPQPEQKQEGTQDEEGQNGTSTNATGNEAGSESNENGESGALNIQVKGVDEIPEGGLIIESEEEKEAKQNAQAEREFQFGEHKRLFGAYPDAELSTDEIAAKNLEQMNLNNASKRYFDLLGKQPLSEMTLQQINSSIEIEEKRQEEAKQNNSGDADSGGELEYNPNTQMLIVSKKDKNDKRVINKVTFEFIKADYDAVISEPKELKDLKNK